MARDLRTSGIACAVGFQRRYDPEVADVVEAARSGKLGQIANVTINSRDPVPPSKEYLASMGNHFMDTTIHDFDLLRAVAGEVSHIFAKLSEDQMDSVVCGTTFSGTTFQIINSRQSCKGYDQRIEIFGREGRAAIDSFPHAKHGASTDTPSGDVFFIDRWRHAYKLAITHFIHDVVLGGETPRTKVEDAIAAAVLCDTALQSAKRAEEIALPANVLEE